MENSSKLNLGCGSDIREGYLNLDIVPHEGVDMVWDLNNLPLPFENGRFNEIICQDIIEHFNDYIPLVAELYRILSVGGVLRIRVPHFTSKNNFDDPTHKRLFSSGTFEFFLDGSKRHDHSSYSALSAFKKLSIQITFYRCRWVRGFINKSKYRQLFYESTFLFSLFPAENLLITLEK